MATKPAPAIRSAYDERYNSIEVIRTVGENTRFHRGFGTTGTRVELVDMSDTDHGGCPRCGTEEMVLSRELHPDAHDDALFYCMNIMCPHFVQDSVEHDMDKIRATDPHTWDNTAECPSCGTRHTVEVERHSHRHDMADEGASCIVYESCDECAQEVLDA